MILTKNQFVPRANYLSNSNIGAYQESRTRVN